MRSPYGLNGVGYLDQHFIHIVLSVSPCLLILIEVIREDEFIFLSIC